jgi:hypothetical protein
MEDAMSGGFGCWRKFEGFERYYWRKRWVDERLQTNVEVRLELAMAATDLKSARRRRASEDASDLAYYLGRLRGAVSLEGSIG